MEIHEELLCQDIGRYILSHLQVLPFQAADVESKAISFIAGYPGGYTGHGAQ